MRTAFDETVITRHPVATYFALTFAISWGGVLIVVGPGGFPGTPEQLETLLPIAVLAMIAGPSVAGILLTGLIDGKTGLREFLSRLLRWRVDARWYVAALLIAPVLMMAVLLALSLFSRTFLPGIFVSDDKATLVLVGLAIALAAGFFEELGWTGFAIPRLRLRHGVRRGSSWASCGERGICLPARSFPVPGHLQGTHGVGVRSHREPARGDADASESHSQRADHWCSWDSRSAAFDL
jgi:membrane protease YdiL (CAAX protease family)